VKNSGGAITNLLNAIGELLGKPHYKHSDYWMLIEELAVITNDKSFLDLFAICERLHTNFYHNSVKSENFGYYIKKVQELINKLKLFLKQKAYRQR